jgi:hypothetical protein
MRTMLRRARLVRDRRLGDRARDARDAVDGGLYDLAGAVNES